MSFLTHVLTSNMMSLQRNSPIQHHIRSTLERDGNNDVALPNCHVTQSGKLSCDLVMRANTAYLYITVINRSDMI